MHGFNSASFTDEIIAPFHGVDEVHITLTYTVCY